jgi:ATP-dependent RNA helicase DeaD
LTTFKDLGLSNQVLKVLSELGFEKPTEIQSKAIPQLLKEDRDFTGLAQTGTGKTAAFGLPLLERIDPTDSSTQALILAPTRELGQQIAEQLNIFSKYLDRVNVLAVYGGASIATQLKALRKPQHIIIATPGRLIDLIRRKAVDLSELEVLVLDEADEMLNMGFQEEIDKILSYTPEDKNTWLFSATMSADMNRIVKQYMNAPYEVKLNTQNEVNTNIEHQFAMVKHSDKTEALTRFLDANPEMRGVVFCRTKRDTQGLADELLKQNYKADAIHGDLSQPQRDRVMKRFKKDDFQLLIATDVAARGIDVNDLTHVFHFALPDDISYYTHRSGRTARAGKSGTSIAFINGRDRQKLKRLEKSLDISFAKVDIPTQSDIYEARIDNWCIEVLDQKPKNTIDEELLERANLLFANLTKEELTAKLLSYELQKLGTGGMKDLNDLRPEKKPYKERRKPRHKKAQGGGSFNKFHKRKNSRKRKRDFSKKKS